MLPNIISKGNKTMKLGQLIASVDQNTEMLCGLFSLSVQAKFY